jgi:hypothetical protein
MRRWVGRGLLLAALAVPLAVPLAAAPPEARPEPVAAIAQRATVTRFCRALLPVPVLLPPAAPGGAKQEAAVVDLLYCGAVDAGHGRLLGIARPGPAPAPADPGKGLLVDTDDPADLPGVARRVFAASEGLEWIAALALTAEHAPGQLRVTVTDAAVAAAEGAVGPGREALIAPALLKEVPLGGITFPIREGQDMAVDLGVKFEGTGAVFWLTPPVPPEGSPPAPAAPAAPAPFAAAGPPTLTARVPYGFVTYVVRKYFGNNPLALLEITRQPFGRRASVPVRFNGRTYEVSIGVSRSRADTAAIYVGGEIQLAPK